MSFKTPLIVAFSALTTVVAVDFAVRRIAPLKPHILEVGNGVVDYENSDPDVLVLGSSHTRPLGAFAELIPDQKFALVAVEEGTFRSFKWVLQHRLRRLIDERDAAGQLKRKRLARVLLITTYWDGCSPRFTGEIANLPARAWTVRHFVEDVIENGLTDYNRNFLMYRFKTQTPLVMVQSRGEDRIPEGLRRALKVRTDEELARYHKQLIEEGIQQEYAVVERGRGLCDDARQKKALGEILDFFIARDIEITIVSFPLVKETVSEESRHTTLREYQEYLSQLQKTKPFRNIDITLTHNLEIADFEEDMDHVTRLGSKKLAAWALARDFAFLKSLPKAKQAQR